MGRRGDGFHQTRYIAQMRRLPSPAEAAEILARRRTRPARRPPPPAGRALSKLIKSLDERFGQGPHALQSRWREIVGDVLSRRTEPVKLIKPRGPKADGGSILELKVDGPAAAIVQHQAEDIIARVNLVLGAGAVTKLRIIQGPVRAAATPAPKRLRRGAPLDAAQEAALQSELSSVPEGPLREALTRLGRGVLRNGEG